MDKSQSFKEFLVTQTPHVDIIEFAINLALASALTVLLAAVYSRYGNALSNRKAFSRNLILIGMTTVIIITIVKSSLALSLGLVGALSIVRFRTPIKEPEELAYLFLSIAIGLGLGAGQRLVVVIGFSLTLIVIWLLHLRRTTFEDEGMMLSVVSSTPDPELLDRIVKVLEQKATAVRLLRLDEDQGSFQGDFSVSFDHYDQLNAAKHGLRDIDKNLQVSFLDNRIA